MRGRVLAFLKQSSPPRLEYVAHAPGVGAGAPVAVGRGTGAHPHCQEAPGSLREALA